jgi:hypothetical protein
MASLRAAHLHKLGICGVEDVDSGMENHSYLYWQLNFWIFVNLSKSLLLVCWTCLSSCHFEKFKVVVPDIHKTP